MMTLEEAIKHCKDVALSCTNKKCALEHFQLLKWLQEYSNILEKQGEQNHVEWSEEDIEMLNSTILFVEHSAFTTIGKGKNNVISWLKSLKDKVQPKTGWSEEDKDMVRYIGNAITCEESVKYLEEKGIDMIKAHRWLESFEPQFRQKWSKEDIDIINGIIIDYEAEIEHLSDSAIDEQAKPIYQESINFLNRLKSLYPVKQEWSEEDEEMIEGLNNCLDELEEENGWYYVYVNNKNVKLNKVRNWLKSLKFQKSSEK